MTHLTTANLQKLLDVLVDRPSWKVAMRAIGASEQLAFVWRSKSIKAQKDGDTSSPFFLEWRGAYDYWHAHAGRARTENIILYESVLRDQAINGIETPVLGPDQRPVYCEDPDLIDVSDEDLWNLLGRRNRYLLDPKTKRPVPLTKVEQLPAPLRLAVLRQDKRYIEQTAIDVKLTGEIVTAKPLQRRPDEPKPDVSRLRELARMSPEERRAALGASGIALDNQGRRTIPRHLPSSRDDNLPVIEQPSPYAAPYSPPPAPEPQPRPSYARPSPRLDRGEGVGEGTPPSGGMKVR